MPTALKVLHGEHRASQLNLNEPRPRPELPQRPDDASDEVTQVWEHTVGELAAMGIAHAADTDALRCYCEAVVTHRRASALVARTGVLVRGQKNNLVKNPALVVQAHAAQQVRAFAAEFGLTPAARCRIEVDGDTDRTGGGQDNPFAWSG